MKPVRLFDAATLAFAAFWATPILRKDLDVLVGCGRVAERPGVDSPSTWFTEAATCYPSSDAIDRLARQTCLLVGRRLAAEVPS